MEKTEITNEVKKADFLNEFLWICAGVNRRILRQCPTDYAKYAGIGGTILFTALMAMLSGGYAMYTVFNNTYVAVCFGVFWGLLIFNLDRFMVNTMYSDGTHKITREEWLGGLPRLILAVFLGVVISTPIELRIFQDKIEAEIRSTQIETRQRLDEMSGLSLDNLIQERDNLLSLSNPYQEDVKEKARELAAVESEYTREIQGIVGSKKKGVGPAARSLKDRIDRLNAELDELKNKEREYLSGINSQKKELDEKISKQQLEVQAEIDKNAAASDAMFGFTARLNALSKITEFSLDNISLFLTRFLIMFLFITIEIIPTLFKMMMTSGPYDDLLRSEMHKVRVLSDKRISDINDEINTAVKISTLKNKEKLEAEVTANKEVLSRIAMVQAELLQTAIDEWREEELKKIKANPSAYIKTSSSK